MALNNLASNLAFLRKQAKITQAEIHARLGFPKNTWSNWENEKSQPSIENLIIISQFFDVNIDAIIKSNLAEGVKYPFFGTNKQTEKSKIKGYIERTNTHLTQVSEPESPYFLGMPKVVTVGSDGAENIVHVPVKARAGYLSGYGDPEYIETLPTYRFPGLKNGTFRSFEVEGHSMKPTLLQRDYVVGEWVERLEDMRDNRVHIIITHSQGIVIKRVLNRLKERNKLYLKSDNITNKTEYPIIEIEPQDIKEIWYSRIRFTPDFSEPGEIYTRLNDLEIMVNEIKNRLK